MTQVYFRVYVFGPDGGNVAFYIVPGVEIMIGKHSYHIGLNILFWRIVFSWTLNK